MVNISRYLSIKINQDGLHLHLTLHLGGNSTNSLSRNYLRALITYCENNSVYNPKADLLLTGSPIQKQWIECLIRWDTEFLISPSLMAQDLCQPWNM